MYSNKCIYLFVYPHFMLYYYKFIKTLENANKSLGTISLIFFRT